MAESGTRKKKKLFYQIKDLHQGAQVEVRSVEDGFQGSWHPGVVIACETGSRQVKYDNILADDEGDLLVENVKVFSAYRNDTTSDICDRGRIRPLPPSSEVTEQDLYYGLCVDCYYNEAWWEGVVYDCQDGSSERSIFFPDLGDELMSNVKQLRVTHDWDPAKGEWKPRGKWYFLQIMEEYKNVNKFFPVSIKQIWYDMKAKNEFGEIGEWPFPVHSAWRKLLLQVVDGYLSLTLNALLSEGKICESTELAIVDLQDSRPANNQLVPVQPNALQVICSGQKGYDLSTGPEVEFELHNNSILGKEKRKRWSKFNRTDHNVRSIKPGFCPESVYEYLRAKRPQNFTNNVRRHLLAMGYKMGYCDTAHCYMYETPCGRRFYHLRKCVIFEKKMLENNPQPLKLTNLHAEHSSERKRKMLENFSPEAEDGGREMISSRHNLDFSLQLKVAKTSEVYGQSHTKKKTNTNLDVVPKYFPEAIFQYAKSYKKGFILDHGSVNDARGHLAATGWEFRFKMNRGRKEWHYGSPFTKKTYISLKSVCKAIEIGKEKIGEDPKGLSGGELSLSGENAHRFSFSKRWSRKFRRALRKIKAGKLQKRKPNGYAHSMHSLLNDQEQDGDNGLAKQCSIRVNTCFIPKKKRALGRVRNNSRVLRSSKRAQAKPSSSSQVPLTVLSWLIDNNAVLAREKVQYFRKGEDKPVAEGRITKSGINCSCCGKIYTLSGFEDHVCCNSLRSGTNLFFCRDDKSFVQRQLDMMHQRVRSFAREPLERTNRKRHKSWNDHICSVCHYGGDLILCDRCPSSFHAKCLDLLDIPEGDWFCPSCCCAICKENHFDNADKNILHCHQCKRQYHAHCVRKENMVELDAHSKEMWFCCKMCEKVQWGLQQLLGKPILVGRNDLTWTLVKPMDYLATEHDECDDVSMAENFCKLNVALEVMHECFEPVKEPQTRRDVVEDVIFCRGSNLNRLNFKGFYTVLLERDEEVITVAILRVFGDKVAEIPLIATRFKYRRLGMCRIVMEEIEKNLIKLGVKKMVLPAATTVLNTWTSAFGFTPVTESERSELLGYTFLDFQDTVMCQKTLRNAPSSFRQLLKDAAEVKSINPEPDGSSAISEVSQEDPREGSESVDQGVLVNGTEEKSNCDDNGKDAPTAMETNPTNCFVSLELKEQKIDGDKTVPKLKVYVRRKAAELRPPVSQANCPK